jgi:hypothetical protein
VVTASGPAGTLNSIRCENNPELRFAYTPKVLEPLLFNAMSPSPSLG